MSSNLNGDSFNRLMPAMARECIAIACVHDKRPGLSALQVFTAHFHFGRAADIFGGHAGYRGALDQFNICEIRTVPILITCSRDTRNDAGNGGHFGKTIGRERRFY